MFDMSLLAEFSDWFIDNIENWLLFLLIIATVLTPAVIYVHQRSKIPRLKFGEFIKVDRSYIVDSERVDVTKFFIKVINKNKRSEGNAEECYGFITLRSNPVRTVWEEFDYAGTSFGKEALLLVF
jgi:hypothetical protein